MLFWFLYFCSESDFIFSHTRGMVGIVCYTMHCDMYITKDKNSKNILEIFFIENLTKQNRNNIAMHEYAQ